MSVYDPIARYYDADACHYRDDVLLYREMAQRTGSPILDVMCGTGRVLLPLAEAGYHVTGLDLSQPMLDIAAAKLHRAGLEQHTALLQADIRTAELPAQHFALIFVSLNSFMHLEQTRDQLAALTTMRQALQRDGLLILDLFNPDPLHLAKEDNRLILERELLVDGRQVLKFVASENDMAAQTSAMTFLFDALDEQGQVTRRMLRFTLRWIYRYELEHLLARAGFMLRMLYGSYDLDEYSSESERIIAVASPKRGE